MRKKHVVNESSITTRKKIHVVARQTRCKKSKKKTALLQLTNLYAVNICHLQGATMHAVKCARFPRVCNPVSWPMSLLNVPSSSMDDILQSIKGCKQNNKK